MAKKFAYIENSKVVDAPGVITTSSGINFSPTEQDYINDGRYYELIDVMPEQKEGFVIVSDGFEVSESPKTITIKYKYEEAPVEYRTFSKYKIIQVLMEKGEWTATKQWLEEIGYLDLFNAAITLDESDSNFNVGVTLYKQKFGKTDEEVEELLKLCVI